MPRGTWWKDCLPLLLILAIWVLTPGAARRLANPDEGRYAAIPMEMVNTGDWVTPRLDGVKYFEKPPLLYWVEAATIEIFGTGERALRAPVALFAFVGCVIAYFGIRPAFGRATARTSAMILATSLFYWSMANLLVLDMAVAVLMSATLFFFHLGIGEPRGPRRRAFFYALYASAALATLTKGLIGFLVPGAIMFLWLLIYRQWHRLRPLYLPTGVVVFLAIAAPWHILVALRNHEWLWFYFVHEHWLRFASTVHGRTEPAWYYLPILVLGLVPWTGFLPVSLWRALKPGKQDPETRATFGFFLVWAVFIFAFFSAAGSKLAPYVLPAFPALAVLIGREVTRPNARRERGWQASWIATALTVAVFAALLVAIVLKPGLVTDVSLGDLSGWLIATAVALAASAALAFHRVRRGDDQRATWVLGGGMALFFAVLFSAIVPRIDFVTTKPFVQTIAANGGLTDDIYQFGAIYQDFIFYANRPVGLVDAETELELDLDTKARESGQFIDLAELRHRWNGPDRIWMMLRRRDLPKLQAEGTLDAHVWEQTSDMLLLSNRPMTQDVDVPTS